jgi:glycyl-tRNA synthetase beta chain
VIEKKGRDTAEILSELIPSIMNNFPWPKSMKSGDSNFRWVRPLQSMVCLLDGKVVPVEAGGVTAGNSTEGHRRHGKGPFTVSGFEDYCKTLEGKGKVILSANQRKTLILENARELCAAKGVELVEDEGLLSEVAGLAEWPVVILGDMEPSFLELPSEVIRLSMRTHQKYFAVKKKGSDNLAPHFIVVANQAAPDGGKAIAKGNSKVLSARLADAQFFQSEDAKKRLEDYYDKLDTVVFHKKLGSVRDKAERVAALARELAPKVGADADLAERAAKLAKCDLVTNMVIEFTSLQGQIGADMFRAEHQHPHPEEARRAVSKDVDAAGAAGTLRDAADAAPQGEDIEAIATAIEQHYKPVGPSDSVPTEPVAIAVALADKLDTLLSFFDIGEPPTGSKDPFALRRAGLGFTSILVDNKIRLKLREALGITDFIFCAFMQYLIAKEKALDLEKTSRHCTNIDVLLANIEAAGNAVEAREKYLEILDEADYEVVTTEALAGPPRRVLKFISDRLQVNLKDKGFRHDIIDAVLALGGDDLVDIVNRITALQSFIDTPDGENLLAGYKRAANILKAEAKKGELPTGEIDTLSHPQALDLQVGLTKAKADIDAALASESYATAMTALSKLRRPIDAFFKNVMVVDEDPKTRKNNLLLLGMIGDTASRIADFERIGG